MIKFQNKSLPPSATYAYMYSVNWKKKCEHCSGTGQALDHERIGREMRRDREKAKISLREMARRLGISAAFLSDLERGRRNWGDKIFLAFVKEVGRKKG